MEWGTGQMLSHLIVARGAMVRSRLRDKTEPSFEEEVRLKRQRQERAVEAVMRQVPQRWRRKRSPGSTGA
ncbi:MAG: hypothetical protein AcusKO_34450 [Acuticoccus sp.]